MRDDKVEAPPERGAFLCFVPAKQPAGTPTVSIAMFPDAGLLAMQNAKRLIVSADSRLSKGHYQFGVVVESDMPFPEPARPRNIPETKSAVRNCEDTEQLVQSYFKFCTQYVAIMDQDLLKRKLTVLFDTFARQDCSSPVTLPNCLVTEQGYGLLRNAFNQNSKNTVKYEILFVCCAPFFETPL